MQGLVYLDGKFVPKEKARVSVFDHGLLYGDGVFEGIRSYSGRVFKLHEHLRRLYESAKTIMLTIPLPMQKFEEVILETLRVNRLRDAYIRAVVTRGEGDLGLDPRKCPHPFVFVIADSIELYADAFYRKGLELVIVPTRRNLPEALNPRIKSLNYLNNIMAKMEGIDRGAPEAVMLSAEGYVAECTGDNIFIVSRGRLLTPPTYIGALEGITRNAVIGLAREMKLGCGEEILTRHDLYNADECFLTGTAAEIIPVVKIDGRAIGTGKRGKLTGRLLRAFRQLTAQEGVPIVQRGKR